jgi:hypothetical protein
VRPTTTTLAIWPTLSRDICGQIALPPALPNERIGLVTTSVTFSPRAVSATIALSSGGSTIEPENEFKALVRFSPRGIALPIIASVALAVHYVGYPGAPNLVVMYALLPLGLLLAAEGECRVTGTWGGVPEVLHVRLAGASLVYLGWVLKYVAVGRPIHLYPAGVIALISGICRVSRLLIRFMAHR